MMSLGTLLVKHGWITRQQLGLAISKQRDIGGRLGTCLLEMGAIEEDLLNRSLAEQQGVPSASARDLNDIPEKICRLLPAPIAIRYRAVPFRATHTDVDIAMLEVDNLWLQDELSFIVGRRLNPFIANEARIVEALANYYKAPCSERFTKLLAQLNRSLGQKRESRPHPGSRLVHADSMAVSEPESIPTPRPAAESGSTSRSQVPPAAPTAAPKSTIPLSESELKLLGTNPPADHETVTGPADASFYPRDLTADVAVSVEEAEMVLETLSDPPEIGRIMLEALSQEFTRVMLFKVTPEGVRGWLADGPGVDQSRVESFRVSFEEPSIFLNLRQGGSFFLGRLPEMRSHLHLADCWHKDLADECGIFPIRVRDRLVALIYGDRGPMGLSDLELDLVRDLSASAARAFERCIVERRKQRQRAVRSE